MDPNVNRSNITVAAESNCQSDADAENIDRSHVITIPIRARSPDDDSPSDELAASWCRLSLSPSSNDITLQSMKPKTEADEPNERDRCSPQRCYPLNLPIASSSSNDLTSTSNTRRSHEINRVPSKEEKQRQNEERKTPASSSTMGDAPSFALMDLSSAAVADISWDSIYQSRIEPAEIAYESQQIHDVHENNQLDTNRIGLNELNSEQLVVKPSACGACFIDASTLLDDGEDAFITSFQGNRSVPSTTAVTTKLISCESPNSRHPQCSDQHANGMSCETMKINHSIGSSSNQMNTVLKKSRENLNEDVDRDESELEESISNLSDEQKMMSSAAAAAAAVAATTVTAHNRTTDVNAQHIDIKDQYTSEGVSHKGPTPVALSMLNDANACKTGGTDRQDNERKQGHFLFQNSIQQYSGHVLSPKVQYVEENNSDFSLPSIYSGSSDPYTDNASAFETSSHHSSNYGDRDSHDYGHDLTQYTIGGTMKNEMVICPDTPHNSILQVNLSRTSLGPSDSAIESLSSSESNGITIPTRRSYDDTVPIVSGGASVKDFTPKQCDSPSMQRRTENCPIISVGMSSLDFEPKPKPKERLSSSAMNSWIVDMSDCKKNRRRGSESSTVSTESSRFSDSKIDRSGSSSSHKGLGFYVSLSDMKPPRLAEESFSKSLNYQPSSTSSTSTEQRKKSTGYFIDFSDDSSRASNTPPVSNNEKVQSTDDKKNMFSMFIDIGNNGNNTPSKRDIDREANSNRSLNGHSSMDAAVIPRQHPLTSAPSSQVNDVENKRHSWNTSKSSDSHGSTTTATAPMREHKRSISTSSDKGIMNILDKIPLISKTSSMSIDTPNSPYDDIASKSELSSCYSNNSLTSLSVHSSGSKTAEPEERLASRKRQKDAKINETFDKSSQGSITDGILSKSSPTDTNTDTEDVTFHNDTDDVLLADSIHSTTTTTTTTTNVMETIPEAKEAVVLRRPPGRSESNNTRTERHTMETLQATIEKQKQLLNTVSEEPSPFVKLSDMDKPVPKFELHNNENRPKSVGSRIGKLFDNRAGNRNTWHHGMSKSAGFNLSNLASSMENFKSLSRIFPHLTDDLSNSLPATFEQTASNTSPNEYTMDLFHSDLSTSSATSSVSRSGIDSADELSLSAAQPRRLGEDLLKMFLQEIATDVVIEVNGRRMRAHKCILRSRCQYFAAILAGGWVESAGNVISISGFSYGAVHFALCHIYSGASRPPDGISLMELASLADLLCLEGLKEVAAHSLKVNYCHSFHKPCSGCIDGIMQVFPIALNQGLDDLYRKCLKWACKYYLKVWPSRAFSQLPTELVARCKQHIIAHMISETVIYTMLDCDHLLALLAPCRWASGVEANVRDIIEAAHIYVSDHFASLIASDGFLSLGQGQSWNISRLENVLIRAASSLAPDQACRSYNRITRLDTVLKAKMNKLHTSRIDKSMFLSDYDFEIDGDDEDELDWNPDFIRLVSEMLAAVEQCLVRQCSRAMKSTQWQRMDAELQKKVQKLACLTEPEVRISSRPKTLAYNQSSTQNNRAHDLYQVKMAIQAHTRRSQESYTVKRNAHNQIQADINEQKPAIATRKVTKSSSRAQVPDLISTIKTSKSNVPIRTERKSLSSDYKRSISEPNNRQLTKDKSTASVDRQLKKPVQYTDVKPRYLEPKRQSANGKDALKVRALSSSGSSRTASPVHSSRNRNGSTNPTNNKTHSESMTMSRDSLASPAKKNERLHANKNDVPKGDHGRLSADSLGGSSLHSSVITNKTVSQESLVRSDSGKSTEVPSKISTKMHLHSAETETETSHRPLTSVKSLRLSGKCAQLKVCNSLLSHASSSTVNSSTPSSMTVKSQFSGGNSINSPRELKPYTTPATQLPVRKGADTKPLAKSFLSARSRQILAQKKALSHSDSSKSVPGVLKEASMTTVHAVNKSNSTSNILKGKSKHFPTTLHLRKTAKLSLAPQPSMSLLPSDNPSKGNENKMNHHSLMNPTKSSSMKMVPRVNSSNGGRDISEKETNGTSGKLKSNRAIADITNGRHAAGNNVDGSDSDAPISSESKLQRSSTFCKERSDIKTNDLQIID